MAIDEIKLQQANVILATFSKDCRLEYSSGVYFSWTNYRGEHRRLRWLPNSRGSDFPTISDKVPFGGTCCMATMELTRWIRGMPIRPLGMWKHFCSKTVGMNIEALRIATEFGWPEQVPCVMCGRLVGDGVAYDHYDHKTIKPGPGCWYGEGCMAKAGAS